MTHAEFDQPLGRRLYDLGWRQGAVLAVSPHQIAFVSQTLSSSGATDLHRRNVRQAERLIVISQDCDVVASPSQEPCIETLICSPEKADWRNRIAFNSRRYFVLDNDVGLVAKAAYRLHIQKALAEHLPAPSPWSYGETLRARFVRWLGDRYTRPPLPDDVVDAVQRPIDIVLDTIESNDPDRAALLSLAISELRITLPATPRAPFEIAVLIMIQDDALTSEQAGKFADLLDELILALRQALTSPKVSLLDIRPATEHDLSIAEYRQTAPIRHERLRQGSDRGDLT